MGRKIHCLRQLAYLQCFRNIHAVFIRRGGGGGSGESGLTNSLEGELKLRLSHPTFGKVRVGLWEEWSRSASSMGAGLLQVWSVGLWDYYRE